MSTNMKPSTYCLRRTAIAAVRASDGEKTFFQDFDGQIRETRYEDTRGYSGGDKRSVIGAATHAKYQSPLAAVSTEEDRKAVSCKRLRISPIYFPRCRRDIDPSL